MREVYDYAATLAWLRYTDSYLWAKLALLELELHLFNPNQPRVPGGHPDGGQWTDGDGVIPIADNDRPGGDRYLNPHILDRHVGKSDAELIERMERETFHTIYKSYYLDRNGSFASIEDARDLIRRTLDMNPDALARVVNNQSEQEFLTYRFGFETGREAYREPPDSEIIRMRKTYSVGVRIEHDPKSELGYHIITAFPRNFLARIGR